MIKFTLKDGHREWLDSLIDTNKNVESAWCILGTQKYVVLVVPGKLRDVLDVVHNSKVCENVEVDVVYKVK